jgi:hypothetical protein
MNDLRTAAQQALEALEFMADEWGFTQKANRPERWQAIDALRSALAQQEQEQAVPVAWLRRDELADLQTCNYRQLGADSPRIWAPHEPDSPEPALDLVAVYTHPPRRETEQEPYCYVYEYDSAFGLHREFYPGPYNGKQRPDRTVPVYTHPPRREWQGLTPDAVFASDEIMAANASLGLRIDQLMDLVHAIEQALKERNHG